MVVKRKPDLSIEKKLTLLSNKQKLRSLPNPTRTVIRQRKNLMYVSQHRTKRAALAASRDTHGRTRVVENRNPNSFRYSVKRIR